MKRVIKSCLKKSIAAFLRSSIFTLKLLDSDQGSFMNQRQLLFSLLLFASLPFVAQNLMAQATAAQTITAQPMRPTPSAAEPRLPLREGWTLQSSGKVEAQGEVVSTPRFQAKGWYSVSVPTTVFSALV